MTEYWKSQPRRFCEICKCWFGDNKASIEHHERGIRHKNNVEKRIKEARQKSQDQQEQTRNKSQTLREIERFLEELLACIIARQLATTCTKQDIQLNGKFSPTLQYHSLVTSIYEDKKPIFTPTQLAALRAYESDLAGDPTRRHDSAVRDAIQRRKQAAAAGVTSNSSQWTAAAAAAAYFTNPQPAPVYCEGEHVVGRHARVVSSSSSSSQTCTLKQHSVADVKSDEEELAQWVRGLSPEGYTYYYNTSTGEATLEKPEGFMDPDDDQTNALKDSSTDDGKQTAEKVPEIKEGTNADGKESNNPKHEGQRKQGHERVDPYGSWTTIRVCDTPDPAASSLADDVGSGDDSGGGDSDNEDFSFREKTYPSDSVRPISVASLVKEEGEPTFKKRKTGAKRPQFRKRTEKTNEMV